MTYFYSFTKNIILHGFSILLIKYNINYTWFLFPRKNKNINIKKILSFSMPPLTTTLSLFMIKNQISFIRHKLNARHCPDYASIKKKFFHSKNQGVEEWRSLFRIWWMGAEEIPLFLITPMACLCQGSYPMSTSLFTPLWLY